MNTNKSVTASFLRLRTLSITVQGSGSVTLSPGGGGCSGGTTCGFTYLDGTIVAATPTPGASFAFGQWSGDCTGSGACSVTMTQDRSVTAAFDPLLTVTILGSGSVTSSPGGISCPGTCTAAFPLDSTVTLSNSPAAGFTFGGWSGSCSGSGSCTVTMNAPQSVTATFNPPLTVSLLGSGSVTSDPAGIACPGTCSAVMPYAASVTLTASPDPGWVVDRWTGDCVDFGTITCTLTMDAAKSVTLTFLPLHTLTVTVGGSGTVVSLPDGIACPPSCSAQFVEGSAIGLVAQPQYGYAATWSDAACTDPGSCLVTLNADVSASATFSPLPTHTVTVSVGPGGSVTSDPVGVDCGVSCAAPFPEGQGVDLTPQPAEGYAFSGWSGACTGVADCSITANADASVGAAFTPLYTVAIGVEGSGNGTVTDSVGQLTGCTTGCVGDYAAGTFVSFHAAPALDSTFDGWNGGGCSGTADCAVTVGADGSLAPRFRRTKALLTVSSNSTSQTVTSSTGGIACPGDCTELLPLGTLVTLYATSGDGTQGQVFGGWSDPNSANPCIGNPGSTACTFVLQQDATISAGYRYCSRECGIGFPPQLDIVFHGSGTVDGSYGITTFTCTTNCTQSFSLWTSNLVTLTASPSTGGTPGGMYSGPVFFGVQYPAPCYPGMGGAETCVLMMNTGNQVDVFFSGTTYPLDVTVDGAGTVLSDDGAIDCISGTCTATYAAGVTRTLTAYPESGFLFNGWSGACTGSGPCVVTLDAAKSVTASFTQPTSKLTVVATAGGTITSSPAGIDCGATCSYDFPTGSLITLTATLVAGARFSGFSGSCIDTSTTCTFSLSGTSQVYADFSATFTLFVTGAGSVSVQPDSAGLFTCSAPSVSPSCSRVLQYGTTLTLTETPSAGASFKSWTGCTPTSPTTCTVSLYGTRNTFARFDVNLTVLKTGTGTGTVLASNPLVDCGSTCTVALPANKNVAVYLFAQPALNSKLGSPVWSGDCTPIPGSPICKIVTNGQPKTVTATFNRR